MSEITSGVTTAVGDWYSYEYCPYGSFAVGFNLKIQPTNSDNTALNTIKLLCNNYEKTEIMSFDGLWGNWGNNVYCPNGTRIKGFKYKFDKYAGPKLGFSAPDDTSGNSLYMYCEDDSEIRPTLEAYEGEWYDRIDCPNDQLICGLQVRYQAPQDSFLDPLLYDDTALNDVKFKCCTI